MTLVRLIERLSNKQFMTELDKIVEVTDVRSGASVRPASAAQVCQCGCGTRVAVGRKFCNQAHYDDARGLATADADQVVAKFHQGVSKRQLAHEYGVSFSAVKRLLRKRRDQTEH